MATPTTDLAAQARRAFQEAFVGLPHVTALAPGRVELLGNHTDYNGGLVLAAAIDRGTVAAGRPMPGREARALSTAFAGTESFNVDAIASDGPAWGRYVRGVAWALGPNLTRGFEVALAGNVPLGAGLSSSASLQGALGLFLIHAGLVPGWDVTRLADDAALMELAQVLRRSENDFVGVASGLLDQFSALFGRAGHVLMLDCRTLAFQRVPLPRPAPAIVICDSRTSRALGEGMYNQRRAECERVVAFFQERRGAGAVTQLRDLTRADLESAWDELDPVGRRRARHVLSENERVRAGVQALNDGDLAAFGGLMSASHESSRADFENSSQALDCLIDAARAAPGFLGGKLSGGGWAGCTVNLVRADRAQEFAESVRAFYQARQGMAADVYVCQAAGGAAIVGVGP